MNLGVSVLTTEKRFNARAGFTNKDDRLPEFFVQGALYPSGLVFDVSEEDIDAALQM